MLSSVHNPRVKDVVRLRNRRHRDRSRRFVVEGLREITRALDAGVPLEVLYYCDELLARDRGQRILDHLAGTDTACQPTSPAVFERMSYRHNPDGVLAVAPMPDLELDRLPTMRDAVWLIAAGIEKPGNLGAMLRSADAAGAAGVVAADPATDVFNPNVVRASLGTLFTVPVAVGTASGVRGWLEARRIGAVLARPDAQLEYTEADLRGAVAFVVGSEHGGLGGEWSMSGSRAVRIPMRGRGDSLNAAMAATVLLFEAHRQRNGGGA